VSVQAREPAAPFFSLRSTRQAKERKASTVTSSSHRRNWRRIRRQWFRRRRGSRWTRLQWWRSLRHWHLP